MESYKQQQKKDNKLVEQLVKEFSAKELARMVVRERKKKNKHLNDLRSKIDSSGIHQLNEEESLELIKKCLVDVKPCRNEECQLSTICKSHHNGENSND